MDRFLVRRREPEREEDAARDAGSDGDESTGRTGGEGQARAQRRRLECGSDDDVASIAVKDGPLQRMLKQVPREAAPEVIIAKANEKHLAGRAKRAAAEARRAKSLVRLVTDRASCGREGAIAMQVLRRSRLRRYHPQPLWLALCRREARLSAAAAEIAWAVVQARNGPRAEAIASAARVDSSLFADMDIPVPRGLTVQRPPRSFRTTVLSFDRDGVLCLAGASDGRLRLYDFDEYSARSRSWADGGTAQRFEPLSPLHMVPASTGQRGANVSALAWCPTAGDVVAAGYLSGKDIALYNLAHFPTKPTAVLCRGDNRPGGCTALTYVASAVGGGRRAAVVAGDSRGMLRLWDPRAAKGPRWCVSATGTSNPSSRAAHAGASVSCLLADETSDGGRLWVASSAGHAMLWDLRNMKVPAFGSRPLPTRVRELSGAAAVRSARAIVTSSAVARAATGLHKGARAGSVESRDAAVVEGGPGVAAVMARVVSTGDPGIQSLTQDPHDPRCVVATLGNGWLVSMDVDDGTVTKALPALSTARLARLMTGAARGMHPSASSFASSGGAGSATGPRDVGDPRGVGIVRQDSARYPHHALGVGLGLRTTAPRRPAPETVDAAGVDAEASFPVPARAVSCCLPSSRMFCFAYAGAACVAVADLSHSGATLVQADEAATFAGELRVGRPKGNTQERVPPGRQLRIPGVMAVPALAPVTALACHPATDSLVVGMEDPRICVLGSSVG